MPFFLKQPLLKTPIASRGFSSLFFPHTVQISYRLPPTRGALGWTFLGAFCLGACLAAAD